MTYRKQLDEFKAADGQSEVPDPGAGGSATRAADKSAGETSYSMTTKAEVLSKLMNDLQARSANEVLDVYRAVSSTNNAVNKRSADKMSGGGETYDVTTPSAVKPEVAREHVEEIFTGQELSEELKERAAVVYEAAVNARIAIVEARLEEQYSSALQEAIDLVHEEVVDSVDKYISYVAKEWVEKNEVKVDNSLKAEMAEQLLLSLKETFEANYIAVSEEKADILNDMAIEIETLKNRLSEEFESRVSLEEKLEKYKITDVVDEMSEGMTVVEKQKFLSLVENISYTDFNDFNKKVDIIKETYFVDSPVRNSSAEPLTEDFVYNDEERSVSVPSNMRAYSEAISRIVKK